MPWPWYTGQLVKASLKQYWSWCPAAIRVGFSSR
jgi:hypothetical protein